MMKPKLLGLVSRVLLGLGLFSICGVAILFGAKNLPASAQSPDRAGGKRDWRVGDYGDLSGQPWCRLHGSRGWDTGDRPGAESFYR